MIGVVGGVPVLLYDPLVLLFLHMEAQALIALLYFVQPLPEIWHLVDFFSCDLF